MTLAPPMLALGFVLIGSLSFEPHILTLVWPDGHRERIAATSPDTCATAVRAIELGLWRLGEGEPPYICDACIDTRAAWLAMERKSPGFLAGVIGIQKAKLAERWVESHPTAHEVPL